MTTDLSGLRDSILRADFLAFAQGALPLIAGGKRLATNWHQEAIAYALEETIHGKIKKLIVTAPPRSLKSTLISVLWVAWKLGKNPRLNFVCVSYNSDLADKFARDCKSLLTSPWYRQLFPRTIISGRSATSDFETTAGGGRLATSIEGGLTGRGGDIIIIDDPMKGLHAPSRAERERVREWFLSTLLQRLDDKVEGSIILLMQRLHEDDLAGHLIRAQWPELRLSAIADKDERIPIGPDRRHERRDGDALHPAREPLETLLAIKAVVGSAYFAAQYQQAPVPAEGLAIRREWLKYYTLQPDRQLGDRICQSWDTASKDGSGNDYSVCITVLVRKHHVFVLDVFRKRLVFPDLEKKAIELALKWQADVILIEDASSGQQLIQRLREKEPRGVASPTARKPEGNKESRMDGASARIEAGDLLLPIDAPWLAELLHELLGFPNATYDDQADALTQLFDWLRKRRSDTLGGAPELGLGYASPYPIDGEDDDATWSPWDVPTPHAWEDEW